MDYIALRQAAIARLSNDEAKPCGIRMQCGAVISSISRHDFYSRLPGPKLYRLREHKSVETKSAVDLETLRSISRQLRNQVVQILVPQDRPAVVPCRDE